MDQNELINNKLYLRYQDDSIIYIVEKPLEVEMLNVFPNTLKTKKSTSN